MDKDNHGQQTDPTDVWSPLTCLRDPLVIAALALSWLGIFLTASAMVSGGEVLNTGQTFGPATRQALFVAIGLLLGMAVLRLPLSRLQAAGLPLLLVAYGLCSAVLIPGIGKRMRTTLARLWWVASRGIRTHDLAHGHLFSRIPGSASRALADSEHRIRAGVICRGSHRPSSVAGTSPPCNPADRRNLARYAIPRRHATLAVSVDDRFDGGVLAGGPECSALGYIRCLVGHWLFRPLG